MERFESEGQKKVNEIEQVRKELLEEDPSLKVIFDHPLNANKITPELLATPEFQALQTLAYEGEPEEVAQNFLNHGKRIIEECKDIKGEKLKVKVKDAINCFNEGIDQKCKDSSINFELHLGTAKANMLIKNYGKTNDAVQEAIKYNKTAEAFYYGAMSRFHVDKWQECIDYCKEALKIEENHKLCKEFMKLSLNELMKEQKKMNEMSLINKLEDSKKRKLYTQLINNGIKIGKKLHFLPEDISANLFIDEHKVLHFPVILLYDEFMQTDFIQDFPANTTFREQLSIILSSPAPWDPSHRYNIDNVDVFYETNITEPLDSKQVVVDTDDKYKKVDMDSDLLSVLQESTLIVPQYPIFILISKDSPEYGRYVQ